MAVPEALLQPDTSHEVYFRDGSTGVAYTTTIGELVTVAHSLGYNSLIIESSYWDYYQTDFHSIVCFNVNNVEKVYFANNEIFPDTRQNMYLNYDSYAGQNGVLLGRNNTGWIVRNNVNISNVFSGQYYYNNIRYARRQQTDTRVTIPEMLYTFADVTIYINDSEYQPYTWTCIDSVNGKGGLRVFSKLKDEDIRENMDYSDSDGSTIERFNPTNAFNNLLVGNETDWFWAGELDRATVTMNRDGTNFTYTFKFYMAHATTPFISWTYNPTYTPSMGFIIDSEQEVVKPFVMEQNPATGQYFVKTKDTNSTDMHNYYLFFRGHIDDEDPEDDPETSEPEDDGDDSPWDDISIEGLTTPGASAVATGFTTMYEVSSTELKALSDFMWSSSFVDNVKKFFGDPKDIIVGLSIFPVKPPVEASPSIIQAGGISTGVSGSRLSDEYLITDTLGSLYIKKSLKQRFLNYPPNVSITAHLPFVGEHSLDVNDITGKTLSLRYIFDFLTGSCVAEISVDGKPRYFFGGSCSVQIPTSSEDFSRIYSNIISAGATIGGTLSTLKGGKGSMIPNLGSIFGAGANTLQSLMSMSPDVAYNSGGGSINGLLSSQMAYLTIETPNPKYATGQKGFVGRPCYMHWKLGDLSGFTKTIENHLENIPCTDAEKDSIDSMLKSGVIIRTGSPTPSATPSTTGNIVISFMKCNSENNVIGKSWDEETGDIISLEGKLIYNQSISTPRLIIEGDIRGYNYCYISEFGRFYYIKDIVLKENHFEEISLGVDVLQSFKDYILECNSLVERQENEYNTYYNNSYVWTKQNKNIVTVPFVGDNGEGFKFSRENNTYILTVAGG